MKIKEEYKEGELQRLPVHLPQWIGGVKDTNRMTRFVVLTSVLIRIFVSQLLHCEI